MLVYVGGADQWQLSKLSLSWGVAVLRFSRRHLLLAVAWRREMQVASATQLRFARL